MLFSSLYLDCFSRSCVAGIFVDPIVIEPKSIWFVSEIVSQTLLITFLEGYRIARNWYSKKFDSFYPICIKLFNRFTVIFGVQSTMITSIE